MKTQTNGTLDLAGYRMKWNTEENHLEIYDNDRKKDVFSGSYEAFCAENGVDFNVSAVVTNFFDNLFGMASASE